MSRRPLLPAAAVVLAHCGASTQPITDAGADAAQCALAQGAIIDVTPADRPVFRLLDAIATREGALVAVREQGSGETHPLSLVTLADGAAQRETVAQASAMAESFASLAADPSSGARYALFDGSTDGCTFVRRGTAAPITQPFVPSSLGEGFTLEGCRDLLRTNTGLSFLSEQVRAVFGTEQVRIDAAGSFVQRRTVSNVGPPAARPTRSSDQLQAFSLIQASSRADSRVALTVQQIGEDGMPITAPQLVAELALAPSGATVVRNGGALMAVWGGAVDTFPPVFSLMTRRLDARANPAAPIVEHTELGILSDAPHAVFARGAVYVTARFVDGAAAQRVIELGEDGRPARAPIALTLPALGAGQARSRVVSTAQGLMVVTEVAVSSAGARVIAVPLRCS